MIVVRQRDGSIKAFINACRHRGSQLCTAEAGCARNFVCNYHGWTYGLDGELLVVPLEKELYRPSFDKPNHGLRPVPLLESFHGFVYSCFDTNAPSLLDYLGDMAWYLEIWMDAMNGIELVGPRGRSFLNCNWKIPAENFVGDAYHIGWTHGAALQALGAKKDRVGNAHLFADGPGYQATTRHGHGLGSAFDPSAGLLGEVGKEINAWQATRREKIDKKLGKLRGRYYGYHMNGNILPNNSFLWGTMTFKLWAPKGPEGVEVNTWAIVEKDMPQELKDTVMMTTNRMFGTGGMLESDDADNMETITQVNRGYVTQQGYLNSQMGLGMEHEHPEMPGLVSDIGMGETGYRGFYRFYQEMLNAPSWDDFRKGDATWKDGVLGTSEAAGKGAQA